MVTQSSVGPTAAADSISYSRSAPACPVPRGVNTTTSASAMCSRRKRCSTRPSACHGRVQHSLTRPRSSDFEQSWSRLLHKVQTAGFELTVCRPALSH